MSGEMHAAGRIVNRMQMRILAAFLAERAVVLNDMAVRQSCAAPARARSRQRWPSPARRLAN